MRRRTQAVRRAHGDYSHTETYVCYAHKSAEYPYSHRRIAKAVFPVCFLWPRSRVGLPASLIIFSPSRPITVSDINEKILEGTRQRVCPGFSPGSLPILHESAGLMPLSVRKKIRCQRHTRSLAFKTALFSFTPQM